MAPKGPLQCKRCQRFGHTQHNCGYAPRCVACGVSQLSGGCSTPRAQPQCCGCGRNHTANYRVCVKWKEAKAALAKQEPVRRRKSVATGQPAAPKAQRAGPSARQRDLGEGWNHVVRGGRVIKATTTPLTKPNPNLSTQLVTEAPEQPKEKRRGLRRLNPNLQQPLRRLLGSPRRKKPRVSKPRPPNPQNPTWWPHTKFHLPTPGNPLSPRSPSPPSIVELYRRALTSISSLPTGADRPWAVLKNVILFVAEYESTP